jgi:hypothetical protein
MPRCVLLNPRLGLTSRLAKIIFLIHDFACLESADKPAGIQNGLLAVGWHARQEFGVGRLIVCR